MRVNTLILYALGDRKPILIAHLPQPAAGSVQTCVLSIDSCPSYKGITDSSTPWCSNSRGRSP
jgi:hypothetical protein